MKFLEIFCFKITNFSLCFFFKFIKTFINIKSLVKFNYLPNIRFIFVSYLSLWSLSLGKSFGKSFLAKFNKTTTRRIATYSIFDGFSFKFVACCRFVLFFPHSFMVSWQLQQIFVMLLYWALLLILWLLLQHFHYLILCNFAHLTAKEIFIIWTMYIACTYFCLSPY